MISTLPQLYGSVFLVWLAVTKSKIERSKDLKIILPNYSSKSNLPKIKAKHREYLFNIAGFMLILLGYMIQLIDIDYSFFILFSPTFSVFLTICGFYFLNLIIIFIADRTVNSFADYVNSNTLPFEISIRDSTSTEDNKLTDSKKERN